MSETKNSRFKRPEQTATGATPDVEQFIKGGRDQGGEDSAQQTKKDQPMKRLTIDIPESLHKRVKSQCGAQGTTIAEVIRHYLEKKFPEPKVQQ